MLWEPQPPFFFASMSAPVLLLYAHRERTLAFNVSSVDETAARSADVAAKLERLVGSCIDLEAAQLTASQNDIHNFHSGPARWGNEGSPEWGWPCRTTKSASI
jgi:hypothetical protein